MSESKNYSKDILRKNIVEILYTDEVCDHCYGTGNAAHAWWARWILYKYVACSRCRGKGHWRPEGEQWNQQEQFLI